MNGFKSQQHRWTKGSIQTCKKLLPAIWRSELPLLDQDGGDRPPDLELRLPPAGLSCAFSCIRRRGGPQPGWVRTLLIDVPIFLTASVSVAVFYICAQRELHPRTWMKEILLLPCLLALGVGLSLNNARAVLEAVFNHQSDFTRTPKYGIERKSQPWRSCKYMPLKSLLPARRNGFCDLFQLLRLVRHSAPAISVGTLSAHVPRSGFFMSRFAQSGPGCRNSALAVRARRPQFLRDKRNICSKKSAMSRVGLLALLFSLTGSALHAATFVDMSERVIISVQDQKLMLLQNGAKVATYPVSTSKFGVGDACGRMTTPLGVLQVAQKIGDHAPSGAVFHNRRLTGEVIKPNAPGRDPIMTRIIWLRGLEAQNAHAFSRCIYIHGTPEEKYIGRPASYGCIRMKVKGCGRSLHSDSARRLCANCAGPFAPRRIVQVLQGCSGQPCSGGNLALNRPNPRRSRLLIRPRKSAVVAQNIPHA